MIFGVVEKKIDKEVYKLKRSIKVHTPDKQVDSD